MIVATIEISFSKGSAPDLIAHMVEDGRQYCFIPDCDLPAECSADIEIVKPDGLFVIAHCTVDNNRIIVPIPEQATTVRGMAHYIIKVKQADEAVIFSASGTIWVDDGLITDDMLESIAQVYGLKFPDDFLTTADLTNYVTIDDLRAALSDYALKTDIIDVVANPSGTAAADLSKIKIGSEIYKIPDPLNIYSTDEHIVGRWIDGSPLYEKSYHISTVTSTYITVDSTINTSTVKIRDASMGTMIIGGAYDNAQYVDGRLSNTSFIRIILSTGLTVGMDASPAEPISDFDFTIRYSKTSN